MNHYSAQRGFSLAEMMATLAIAAVTATLAVPSMKNILAEGQRTTSTNKLISTLHTARSVAITRNEQVTICPSSDAEHCNNAQWQDGWIYFVDHNHDRHVNTDDEVLGRANGINDIRIFSQDFERFVAFRPNGQIMVDTTAENSGEMLLCDDRGPGFSRSLILHVGGKPQLTVDEDPGAYTICSPA